jgi:hypothetical protein
MKMTDSRIDRVVRGANWILIFVVLVNSIRSTTPGQFFYGLPALALWFLPMILAIRCLGSEILSWKVLLLAAATNFLAMIASAWFALATMETTTEAMQFRSAAILIALLFVANTICVGRRLRYA